MSVEVVHNESEAGFGAHAARRAVATPLPAAAQKALTFGLLLSAVRCTLQYVLLPFLLPWVGLAASIPPWAMLVLSGIALASLSRNVRNLWRMHHARRWSYLGLAMVVGSALVVFMVVDVRSLFGA